MKKRVYTRAELEAIFHTSRTDSMRKSLKRAGYTFESGGRGADYWIEITDIPAPPSPYEEFMRREFDCGPQTNLAAAEAFFSLLLTNAEFCYYPATYQAQVLRKQYQIEVSDQTLRNWKKRLEEKNWFKVDSNDNQYYLCRKGEKPQAIDATIHNQAWKKFYSMIKNGENPGDARSKIFYEYGGMPRKQAKFAENGIEHIKLSELRSTLKKNA